MKTDADHLEILLPSLAMNHRANLRKGIKLGRQRFGTVSWVLCDESDAHHPLSPVIKLGLRHPRKKERRNVL